MDTPPSAPGHTLLSYLTLLNHNGEQKNKIKIKMVVVRSVQMTHQHLRGSE
jgi:hypothetical protein